MTKKIISVVLVLATVFIMFTMVASAASYSTGTYKVAANSGINVRNGAGTNYSKVGAASKGISFTVSKQLFFCLVPFVVVALFVCSFKSPLYDSQQELWTHILEEGNFNE